MPDEYNKSALPAMDTKPPQKISTLPLAWAQRAAFRYLFRAALYNRNGSNKLRAFAARRGGDMHWLLRAASLVLLMSALCAGAQTYPNKPIRLVVPYPPGALTDLLARIVGQKLAGALGQPVIVENKPGAGTIIGVEAVAKCAPDGYTLLMATSTTLAISPRVYRKLSYDTASDFVPV